MVDLKNKQKVNWIVVGGSQAIWIHIMSHLKKRDAEEVIDDVLARGHHHVVDEKEVGDDMIVSIREVEVEAKVLLMNVVVVRKENIVAVIDIIITG